MSMVVMASEVWTPDYGTDVQGHPIILNIDECPEYYFKNRRFHVDPNLVVYEDKKFTKPVTGLVSVPRLNMYDKMKFYLVNGVIYNERGIYFETMTPGHDVVECCVNYNPDRNNDKGLPWVLTVLVTRTNSRYYGNPQWSMQLRFNCDEVLLPCIVMYAMDAMMGTKDSVDFMRLNMKRFSELANVGSTDKHVMMQKICANKFIQLFIEDRATGWVGDEEVELFHENGTLMYR